MRYIFVVTVFCCFASCDSASKVFWESEVNEDRSYMIMTPPPIATDLEPAEESTDKKLIRKANLTLRVQSISGISDSVKSLITKYGYASSENKQETDSYKTQSYIIRVPENYFDSFISDVEKLSIRILTKEITVNDVNDEFVDNQAVLKTKKALENRYYEILQRANTVKDMLAIEEQLGTVRKDIELIESRQARLNNQSAYSTIDLTFSELEVVSESPLASAFGIGWERMMNFFFGMISFWPVIIGLILPGYFLISYQRKRKLSKKSSAIA